MEIEKLKTFIQSANINFLFGSGLSLPYLRTLGNIEKWLTELNNKKNVEDDIKIIVEASIYKEYFEKVIYPNSFIYKEEMLISIVETNNSIVNSLKSINDELNAITNNDYVIDNELQNSVDDIEKLTEELQNSVDEINKIKVESISFEIINKLNSILENINITIQKLENYTKELKSFFQDLSDQKEGINKDYQDLLYKEEEIIKKLTNEIKEFKENLGSSTFITKSYKDNLINLVATYKNYKQFLTIWNEIINKRASKLLSKQVNIYTTNIDTFVENAADELAIEFNDGFKGSINQKFDEGNFQKSFIKTSLHYKNISEIPVFNLLKMHGSINWKEIDDVIYNDYKLEQLEKIRKELKKIEAEHFVKLNEHSNIDDIIKDATNIKNTLPNNKIDDIYIGFLNEYRKLIIVNPTKRKFSETVMDIHFYDLMRMFSNSLEKENTVLFVMGFSFADEHIRALTIRAANANPTLQIIIFSYGDNYENSQEFKNIINNNVYIFNVNDFKENNSKDESIKEKVKCFKNFDFRTINNVFALVNNKNSEIDEK